MRETPKIAGIASLLAVITAAITHGVFESTIGVLIFGALTTFVLLTVGSVLQVFRRTKRAGLMVVRCGLAVFVAIPLTFVANRGVVAIDLWNAKRYVAARLAPQLERYRAAHGRYPARMSLWEQPPADAPWLIRNFSYGSDGRQYELFVMDPGVCGRIATYTSRTRAWTHTYDPCWY
jgi:hypothetical protein